MLWTVCGCSCLLSSLIFDQFFDVSLAWTSELFGVETLVLADNISSFLGTFLAIFGCPLLFLGIQIIAVFSFFSFFFFFSFFLKVGEFDVVANESIRLSNFIYSSIHHYHLKRKYLACNWNHFLYLKMHLELNDVSSIEVVKLLTSSTLLSVMIGVFIIHSVHKVITCSFKARILSFLFLYFLFILLISFFVAFFGFSLSLITFFVAFLDFLYL